MPMWLQGADAASIHAPWELLIFGLAPHPEKSWEESSVVDAISVSAPALSIRAVRLWKYSLLPHTTLHSLEFFGRHSMPGSEVP